MVDREVNPLEQRHLALSARFKAAWAFHQLLMGMQRLNGGAGIENRSEQFRSLYARLKTFSENLHGPTTGLDERSSTELSLLEHEVQRLYDELIQQEEAIAPSELRRFFSQVKALDDRILIEVVRFYLEIQTDGEWSRDRLDKVDYLVSRLAEKIAGPDLQADRLRLERVLEGLLTSTRPVLIPNQELQALLGTLQDLRSEVRWIKTFGELNESHRLEVYRALKHDMAGRIFHPKILPLVIEVNNAFRRKIEELRIHEEHRLIDDYQQLSQLQERSRPPGTELQAELTRLQEQVEEFRDRARSNNVRLTELSQLGKSLREVTSRLEVEAPEPVEKMAASLQKTTYVSNLESVSAGLVPDLDCLQPHWSAMLKALSGLGTEITDQQARSETSLAAFRLAGRELVAFRRTVGTDAGAIGQEQFVLAAAALRRRICEDVEELRSLESRLPGSTPPGLLQRSRESMRIADAFVKHFSHLFEQAVFDGQIEEAQELQLLQRKLLRESSGLVLLMPRRSEPTPVATPSTEESGELDTTMVIGTTDEI